MTILIDHDRGHFGRRQGANDKLRRIRRPENDIDALTSEFVGYRRHAHAAHADTGADRIDTLIVRLDRDLGTHARVARRRLDFEQTVVDFRHFHFEELDDEFRRRARKDQLRTAGRAIDTQQKSLDAVADTQVLARDHLVTRQNGLDLSGLNDRIAPLHSLDRTGNEVLLALKEVIEDLLALGVADLLQNHLLGGLCANPAKIDGFQRLFQVVANIDVRILLLRVRQGNMLRFKDKVLVGHHFPTPEGLEIARFAINHHANIGVVVNPLFRCRRERQLESAEDNLLAHVLFTRQNVYQKQNFAAHILTTPYPA